MRYVIAGKSDSFKTYLKKNKYSLGKDAIYTRSLKQFNKITEEDVIVLLYGWWARSWAKTALKEVVKLYPSISIDFLDGPFGENERNLLKSEKISNRFDLLDL